MAAGEHRHGVDERPRRGLLEQVAEDDDQRALGALDGLEGELVVRVDGARLEVEQRAHDRVAARAPRRQAAADAVVEGDDAAAVADRVGDERDGDGGVDRGVEPRAVLERRRHQAPGVEQQHHLAVLLDAVLVAHRPPRAVRGAPVDLARVVVGRVVADRLEVRAEAERAARQAALLAEAPLAHGEREPARGGQVGVDEQLVLLARRGGASARARAGPRCARRPRRACGARGAAGSGARRAARRPRAARAPGRAGSAGARARARRPAGAASTVSGAATPRARIGATRRSSRGRARTASASASVAPASASAASSADGRADRDGRERDDREQRRGARGGAHACPVDRAPCAGRHQRGTGTSPSAVRTASSGP